MGKQTTGAVVQVGTASTGAGLAEVLWWASVVGLAMFGAGVVLDVRPVAVVGLLLAAVGVVGSVLMVAWRAGVRLVHVVTGKGAGR